MFVMFFFRVRIGGVCKESPRFGSGDLERLGKIFPGSSVIEALENHGEIGSDEMELFYRQAIDFYAANEVSDEPYQTGNFNGSFAVTSSLASALDDLIEFCEKGLGFHLEGDARLAIADKQRDRQRQRAEYRSGILEFLGNFPNLKPPTDEMIKAKLVGKRQSYVSRKAKANYPPPLAFSIDRSYRLSVYKIELIDLLLSGQEVSPAEFCGRMFDEHGPEIDVEELFIQALGVISIYIGTPLIPETGERSLVQATT